MALKKCEGADPSQAFGGPSGPKRGITALEGITVDCFGLIGISCAHTF